MGSYVIGFEDVSRVNLSLVGGKGANLGELCKIEGIQVPNGFCITTEAFKRIINENPPIGKLIDQLSNQKGKASEIRTLIEEARIPQDIIEEISQQLTEQNAYAIRSSATSEDLLAASSAGQQDTYLNIIGKDAILKHISKCWASLFTDRAIIYRAQNKIDHSKVYLSVIVQNMVFPESSGILFTADPIAGNRKIVSIDASFGLGEALVAGLVNADNYKVEGGKIIDKKISYKKLEIHAVKGGGTKEQAIKSEEQNKQALTDEQILQLEQTGRRIEKHFGRPQDIEWCISDGIIYIVQSRPITTLFPIPETNDNENHVFISVGHQQMMTDAMKPLGLSVRQLNVGRAFYTAGGRLFVDVARELSSPKSRHIMINVLGNSDPLIKDALSTIVAREGFLIERTEEGPAMPNYQAQIEYDPAIVPELIKNTKETLSALKQNIQSKSGTDLIDFIIGELQKSNKDLTDSRGFNVIMTAMNTSYWINDKMKEWLGETNAVDTLTQSVPNNITSEMGLELLDVADIIRPYPDVVEFLHNTKDDHFIDGLTQFKGGKETRDAILSFLDKYGMRCAGEIDITRPRWSEKPTTLLPIILSHIKNFEPGESRRKFEQGKQEAFNKEQEIVERLRQLPDGEQKAEETKQKINIVRNYAGYREFPKYAIVTRDFIFKQALLKEAEQLVRDNIINDKEDIYYLSLEELREICQPACHPVRDLITQRKEEFKLFERLTPPRVMTSDGEIITGKYNRENLPADAIVGLAVSSGVIEGRARVIFDMEDANLEEGDILVTSFTDPSWTPLFVWIKGLVTEVGGLMTHGAVIAREYGLPAVVGVENAVKLIKDGQRIRVNGTEGYVEIIE